MKKVKVCKLFNIAREMLYKWLWLYMKCPNAKCGRKIQVPDSREKNNGYVVKRRRRCFHCNQTWTTCEVIQSEPSLKTSFLSSQQNLTPHEVYNEIIRLLGLL